MGLRQFKYRRDFNFSPHNETTVKLGVKVPGISARYCFLPTSRHAGDHSYQAAWCSPDTILKNEIPNNGEPTRCRQVENGYRHNRHTYGYEDFFPDFQTLALCIRSSPFEGRAPLPLQNTPQP
jgi:hypothetical protein